MSVIAETAKQGNKPRMPVHFPTSASSVNWLNPIKAVRFIVHIAVQRVYLPP